MADLLLSLATWMLISLSIIPMGIQFINKSIDEKEYYYATVILYETLHEILIEGEILLGQTVLKNGIQYEIIPDALMKEVCIQFDNKKKETRRVCEFLE